MTITHEKMYRNDTNHMTPRRHLVRTTKNLFGDPLAFTFDR
jgi:hypothetical protein